ncbi:RING-type E3 ubiquitin transferase [Sarracenia purpurea var. burkii]
MGTPPQNGSSPHLYSQEVQLRLYQAFIFSVPILFSIILFLLFYLFYLKRRAYISSPPPSLPITSMNQSTSAAPSLTSEMEMKGEVKEKLPLVLVDEDLRAKDLQCCVCLGEFELEEKLGQVPSCRHVFHVDCIAHWLHSNSTCPLCRCSINDDAPPPIHQFGLPQPPQSPPPIPSLPPSFPLSNEWQSHPSSSDHHRLSLLEEQRQL